MNARKTLMTLAICGLLAACVAPIDQQRRQETITALRAAASDTESGDGLPILIPRELVDSTAPAVKIGSFMTRVRSEYDLPDLAGMTQLHEVAAGEDLLMIAHEMGIGFRALRDANPSIDEWEPKVGTEIVVPTRWILPQGAPRGLLINVAELRLFMFPDTTVPGEDVPVLTWPIGAGDSLWQTPIAPFTITSKDTNPTWVVPASIYSKMQHPRRVVPPGPDNPLGKHRIRLSLDTYLIHGTNDPWTVGRLTTHGCVRLYPEDVAFLYTLVDRGTTGVFVYQPVKLGRADDRIYVEVHRDIYQRFDDLEAHAFAEVARAGLSDRIDRERLKAAVQSRLGMPIDITRTLVSDTPAPGTPASGTPAPGTPASDAPASGPTASR